MSTSNYELYEKDLYAWSKKNAQLLRERKFDELDIEHLAEEIESVGKHEEDYFVSNLIPLVSHLFKLKFATEQELERCKKGWIDTVEEQRRRCNKYLKKNPSLKYKQDELYDEAFESGCAQAAIGLGKDKLEIFESYSFSLEKCLSNDFFPEN